MKSVLITSSILIVLIAALRPLLRGKIDPRMQYALWLLVALRLLVPVNLVHSAYSALALLERTEEPRQIVEAIGQTSIPAQSYDDAHAQIVEEYRQQGVDTAALTPRDLMDIDAQARERMRGPTLAELAARYARPVWLGGAVLMAAWFLLVNARLRRKLGRAELLEIEESCGLPVFVSAALPSPCLSGFLRPAVFVTPMAAEDPDRLRHVLAHETTHYRHRDHWWALVRCLCLCLYWFDPLVWWAAVMSRQDCELACDAGAIRRLGEAERLSYGRTLVGMIASGRSSLLQTATTMTGGRRRVRERVSLIARKPKTVIALALALVLVLALAVGCTFTGAPEGSALSADTLRERLEDIPEDLRDKVAAAYLEEGARENVLVNYRLDVPAEWVDGQPPRVLAVEQISRTQYDTHGYPEAHDTDTHDIFAQDSIYYYSIVRTIRWQDDLEDEELFTTVYESLREFAVQTVLATEGVEPYEPLPSANTLQARLLDLPEELRDNVEARPEDGSLAVYYFKHPGEPVDESQYLLLVLERTEENLEAYRAASYHSGGIHWFAKRGSTYYVFNWNTSIEYSMEDEEQFTAAFRAVQDFARSTILTTEGAEPFDLNSASLTPAQQEVQTAIDAIAAAPSVQLALSLNLDGRNVGYIYQTTPDDYWTRRLNSLVTGYQWEPLTGSVPEDVLEAMQTGGGLNISVPDSGPTIILHEAADIVSITPGPDGPANLYQVQPLDENEPSDSYLFPYPQAGPYQRMRYWFDEVQLNALRVTSIPDRGQSHQEIAEEWVEGFDGAMAKCAPGGTYTCTYIQPLNVKADQPEGLTPEQLENFIQSRNLPADSFGKTWFCFSYGLIFVPENENAEQQLWAGNTKDYTGDDAPEGARIWFHVGYMRLIDGNWVCTETGTGW